MPLDSHMAEIQRERLKRASQQQASLRAQAQQRRAQAEQAARMAEQKRKQQAAQAQQSKLAAQQRREQAKVQARLQAAQERQQKEANRARAVARSQQMLKREQYTVKKGEGPAEIAAATGSTPQAIAGLGVTKFVAGQVLDIVAPQPEAPIVPSAKDTQFDQGVTDVARQYDTGLGSGIDPQGPRQQDGIFTKAADNLKDWFVGQAEDFLNVRFTDDESGTTPGTGYQQPEGPAQEIGRGGLDSWQTADPEAGGVFSPQNDPWDHIDTSKPISAEQAALNADISSARYEYKAIQYVQTTGDMEGRPSILSRFFIESLSYDQQLMLLEDQGYAIDENGRFIAQDIPEVGYGMGGYGDYDYGLGGVGGGEYEAPRTTISYAKEKAGGRVGRSNAGRLTSGYVPSSHWRI